jgi:hypothetical protein
MRAVRYRVTNIVCNLLPRPALVLRWRSDQYIFGTSHASNYNVWSTAILTFPLQNVNIIGEEDNWVLFAHYGGIAVIMALDGATAPHNLTAPLRESIEVRALVFFPPGEAQSSP